MNVSNNNQTEIDNTHYLLPLIKNGLSTENSFFHHDSLMYFFQTNKFWNSFIHTEESTRACTRFCIERMKNQNPDDRPYIEEQLKKNVPPIIIASETGSTYVVKLLMLAKAAPHLARSKPNGYTPLMTATLNGHENIVKMLLRDNQNRESSLQARSTIEDTAVNLAAKLGHVNILKIFARSITQKSLKQDKYNWSKALIHTASFRDPKNVEIMATLLQAYYDHHITPKDNHLATALEVAKFCDQRNLVSLLEEAQARNKSAQGWCVVS